MKVDLEKSLAQEELRAAAPEGAPREGIPDTAMVRKLREPVDQGGYDGRYPDEFNVSVADRLEELWMFYQTEQTMHLAWRKRAEESESESRALTEERDRALAALRAIRSAVSPGKLTISSTNRDVLDKWISAMEHLAAVLHPAPATPR